MTDYDINTEPADSSEAVRWALCGRIRHRTDLLEKYGIERLMAAIDEKAAQYEGIKLDEIGTSDVSCWVLDIEKSFKPEDVIQRTPLKWIPCSGTVLVNGEPLELIAYLDTKP